MIAPPTTRRPRPMPYQLQTLAPGHTLAINGHQGSTRVPLMVGTPTLGVIRYEWHALRQGQVVPINWKGAETSAWYVPGEHGTLGYSVADAQNNICAQFLARPECERLLLWEDDVLAPYDTFVRFNMHILESTAPIVSGLYFSKSKPSWPLLFRGRGNGVFLDWTWGARVWCDGIPTGMLLIHRSILRYMADHSPWYKLPDGQNVPKIFETPNRAFLDPETNQYFRTAGTSDLAWCDRILREDILTKAGWGAHVKRHPRHPFLVDTTIFCQQIDLHGVQYPAHIDSVLWPRKVRPPARGFPLT